MGAWGPGPFDNDSAADLVAKLFKPIERVANQKANASYYYEDARATISLVVIAHGTDILGGPSLQPCLIALARMLNDDSWLDRWRDGGAAVKKKLRAEIRAVERKMQSCPGCSPRRHRKRAKK